MKEGVRKRITLMRVIFGVLRHECLGVRLDHSSSRQPKMHTVVPQSVDMGHQVAVTTVEAGCGGRVRLVRLSPDIAE